jgi:peptide/nickel transport system substrate-binding protein
MKARTLIACLVLLSLTAGLWTLTPPATTAVRAAGPQTTRQGAWLDAMLFTEQDNPDQAVAKLQADELDVYAHALSGSYASLFQTVLENPDLTYTISRSSYTEITGNPVPVFNDGRINPFGVARFREAINMLIDRNYLVEEIIGGLGVPKFTTLISAFPDYARYADTIHDIEAMYAYNPDDAEQIIADVMVEMGATMGGDGKWQHNGAPVTLVGIIRTEDERKEYGDYMGHQLESAGFTVDYQYKTGWEAWPIWHESDPAEGLWSWYTGAWPITAISRDEATSFGYFYTPLGSDSPLWQAYTPSDEFMDVAERLWTNDFADMEERAQLFEEALYLSMEDSVRIWLVDAISFAPRRAETVVASDLAGNAAGAQMFPYVARFEGVEGGSMRIAQPDMLVEPWNPIAGSNWIYDQFPIRATQDDGLIADPNTGLYLPQRIASAECVVKEGLPVTRTLDWLDLSFAPVVDVPEDAWADWDASAQTFIQVGNMPTPTLEANTKCTVTYPADLFTTVTWHDGSPIDVSDFIMRMIMTFDRAKTESAIYDESAVPAYTDFMSHFRGVVIESTDPLVITTYDDRWTLDAELKVLPWWPNYSTGPAAWHNLTPAIRAEEAGQLAFSADKAGSLGVEWTSFIAGPGLSILANWMDQSAGEHYIPYEPTMGAYVTTAEADARWASLQAWYAIWGHFWLGTGPFYVASASPVPGGLALLRYAAFPDTAGRWDAFTAPHQPQIEINHTSGAPGSYFNVTGMGFPAGSVASITANGLALGRVTTDGNGALAFTLVTEGAGEAVYHLVVRANPVAGLALTLDEAEPAWPRSGHWPLVPLVPGYFKYLYLPVVLRNHESRGPE